VKGTSVTIVDQGSATETLGVSFRRQRPGPESELVGWFLEEMPIVLRPGHRATIFREPRLASGFPDLVVVVWDTAVAKDWQPARAHLRTQDIRLMHYLAAAGPCSEPGLRAAFAGEVGSGLARLEEAAMVRRVNGQWQARSLATCFAARHIVAIEAKVKEWASAVLQAALNTWFASRSYVLLPGTKADRCARGSRGLGCGCVDQGGRVARRESRATARSSALVRVLVIQRMGLAHRTPPRNAWRLSIGYASPFLISTTSPR
jgi:hypothetical protein